MNLRNLLLIVVGMTIAGLFVAGLVSPPRREPAPRVVLKPDDREVVALGQRIYAQRCASCHGARLEGQPNWRQRGPDGFLPAPPHDGSGHTWHHPDQLLFRITKHGLAKVTNNVGYKSAMPVYENVLSDAEIIAALSWIKAQWSTEVPLQHDRVNPGTCAGSSRTASVSGRCSSTTP